MDSNDKYRSSVNKTSASFAESELIEPLMLLETMAEGVVVIDTQGRIRMWNSAMEELTGYGSEEATGKPMDWLRAPGCINSERIKGLMNPQGEKQESYISGCECKVVNRSGETIPVLINARVITDHSGEPIGILNTITDFRPVERLRSEVSSLRSMVEEHDSFEGMVGRSISMQEIFRQVQLSAASDVTVLLFGESGTGKELAAGAIHHLSARNEQSFVRVNCGALTESLLESELFGHVKGSFTGAHRDRIGRFESADGGTLLLDEIGEISPVMQVKLLRILQSGEFERVGESRTRRCDVRVIAATNRDLSQDVRDGNFREDLYYRLRVFPLQMPPLRTRRDDVPLLTEHFIRMFATRTGKAIRGLTTEAMNALRGYPWPGNIRELENAIEYAFVVCQGSTIGIYDLPPELRGQPVPLYPPEPVVEASGIGPPQQRRQSELLHNADSLREALTRNRWSKAATARELGVSHTAVWKWMKRHDIPLSPQ